MDTELRKLINLSIWVVSYILVSIVKKTSGAE